MQRLCIIFFMSVLTSNTIAMDNQPRPTLIYRIVQGNSTILRGIIKRSATGQLECRIEYNAATNNYSGTIINNRYSFLEWHSRELDAEEAQVYYQQLSNVN